MSYNASKSSTSAETIMHFLELYDPNMTVEDVPGIGPASVASLKQKGYATIQALLGLFLIGVKEHSTMEDVCQTFYNELKKMCKANCHTVTFAIAHLADQKRLFEY